MFFEVSPRHPGVPPKAPMTHTRHHKARYGLTPCHLGSAYASWLAPNAIDAITPKNHVFLLFSYYGCVLISIYSYILIYR